MLEELRDEQFCYVTTTGRRTGNPHEIEIWFVVHSGVIFLMAGGGYGADWVKNLQANPSVTVRIGSETFKGHAEPGAEDVDEPAVRTAMAAKYQGWRPGRPLSNWAETALVVRVTSAAE